MDSACCFEIATEAFSSGYVGVGVDVSVCMCVFGKAPFFPPKNSSPPTCDKDLKLAYDNFFDDLVYARHLLSTCQ